MLAILLLLACRSSHLLNYRKHHGVFFCPVGLVRLAWSDDTVHHYRIGFYKDRTFSYGIVDSNKLLIQYFGFYTASPDTLFLHFKEDVPPLCPYLVEEVSHTFLVQFFPNSRKRVFLRGQVPPLMQW